MINYLITQIEIFIKGYSAVGILIVAFLEEIIAPIPSSLIAMFAGFFVIPINYSWIQAIIKAFLEIAIPMSAGITIGSLVFYIIAYFGGKPIIVKYGKFFGLNWLLIEKTEKKFTKGYADEIILFSLRALPFIPSVAISVFCGLVRYPIKKFIIFSFLGSLVRVTIMALVGWQIRDTYSTYAQIISQIETFLLVLIFTILSVFLFLRFKKKKQTNQF